MLCQLAFPRTSGRLVSTANYRHQFLSEVNDTRLETADIETLAGAGGARRAIYVVLAVTFLGLAVLGVVVPGIPTTPFLLLASYFSARSSPRIYLYIRRSKLFGPIVRDWQEHRGVRLKSKVWAISLVLIGLIVLVATSWSYPGWVIAGVALAVVGMAVILRLPTI
jgi:uncharacterized protein